MSEAAKVLVAFGAGLTGLVLFVATRKPKAKPVEPPPPAPTPPPTPPPEEEGQQTTKIEFF